MENFIKQISMRIFQVEEENKPQTSRVIRDRKVSSRRTRSLKRDSRKGQTWGRRQLSPETSRADKKMEGEEFRTAVAAAAFAITSIENKEQEIKQDPNSNSKSRKSFSEIIEESPGPKTSEDLPPADQLKPTVVNSETGEKVSSRKPIGPTSSIEKTPSFNANKQSNEITSQKEPELRLRESDIWEKTQLDKTKERFMKVKARIFEWESKKKSKAKNKLIRKEGKIEGKRARALQDFTRKMETIEKISKGARSENEKKREREEIRVKEKANIIRSTGKIHKPMFLCC
ncbi:putative remorin [Helianthus annuus]|nr:putative remorin [Helianthus annuus]